MGVLWDPEFDVSGIVDLARHLTPTKRNVVSIVGKFYNPLGFLSPVVFYLKYYFNGYTETRAAEMISF